MNPYTIGVLVFARGLARARKAAVTPSVPIGQRSVAGLNLRFDLVRRAQEISVRRVQLPRYPETIQSTLLRVEDYDVSSHLRVLDVDLSLVNDNLSWRDCSTKVE